MQRHAAEFERAGAVGAQRLEELADPGEQRVQTRQLVARREYCGRYIAHLAVGRRARALPAR